MKKCITCKIEKSNNDFYKRNECKLCKINRSKNHYLINKDSCENYNSQTCRQPELILKFIKSIIIPEEKTKCWIWSRSCIKQGYGQFYIGRKSIRAHRYSYLIFKGDIENNLLVCHSCDNPSCVNPSHLWLGTTQENTKDMIKKGRKVKRGKIK